MRVYDGFRHDLLAAGFRVLRYDFLGHGWSYAVGAKYDADMFMTQLDELCDFLLEPDEHIDLFVGHSTGGVLGVLAAMSGKRLIDDLALISPAFWADKPLTGQIADMLPSVMSWLIRTFSGLSCLPEIAYEDNNDAAFAHDGSTYFYPKKHDAGETRIENMFDLHPQIAVAITDTNGFFLRDDLLDVWRGKFEELVKDSTKPPVHLLWGDHDIVVPFKHSEDVLAWGAASSYGVVSDRVTLTALKQMGHESPSECPVCIAKKILEHRAER
jgi:pimeloyl-ACP methyl ester carboxylesterase